MVEAPKAAGAGGEQPGAQKRIRTADAQSAEGKIERVGTHIENSYPESVLLPAPKL